MVFDKGMLSILKAQVTPESGEILMFLKEHYPTRFLKTTIINKVELSRWVGLISFERLEAATLIESDDSLANGLRLYQLSESGLALLELVDQNEI